MLLDRRRLRLGWEGAQALGPASCVAWSDYLPALCVSFSSVKWGNSVVSLRAAERTKVS